MGTVTKKTEIETAPKDGREYCAECLRDTNHTVMYRHTTRWGEELDQDGCAIDGADLYSLVQCKGCDSIRMLHEHWFSEDWDGDGPTLYRDYYPPNVIRQKPNWQQHGNFFPQLYELSQLLGEIYRAMGVGALRVATMGVRALVERIMIDQVQDQNSFEKNMVAFFQAGLVAGHQQDMFRSTLIEAGHAAMHRGWDPTTEDVNTLLDIVEGLVKSIYVDPGRAEKVGERIPKRIRQPKGGTGG